MSEANPTSILRSVAAIFAGVMTVIVLSLGTDVILHATGIYPPWFQPMADPLWVLALAYRIVYGIAGGYVAGRFAPNQPMKHALIVGFIGLALSHRRRRDALEQRSGVWAEMVFGRAGSDRTSLCVGGWQTCDGTAAPPNGVTDQGIEQE
jgi:hypothetical protein